MLQGMQIIPESHLASIGEVVSFHYGVLRDAWSLAGQSYSLKPQRRSITLDWINKSNVTEKHPTPISKAVFYYGNK